MDVHKLILKACSHSKSRFRRGPIMRVDVDKNTKIHIYSLPIPKSIYKTHFVTGMNKDRKTNIKSVCVYVCVGEGILVK